MCRSGLWRVATHKKKQFGEVSDKPAKRLFSVENNQFSKIQIQERPGVHGHGAIG